MTEDQRISAIIAAMAKGETAENMGIMFCLYCSAHPFAPHNQTLHHAGDMIHDADCPVTLARQIMAERDMPLNIYKITAKVGEMREETPAMYTTAFTAKDAFFSHPDYDEVHVELVRAFPVEVEA